MRSEPARIRRRNSSGSFGAGPVIYVCDREMRILGNRGLFFAAELANDLGTPLVVAAVSDTAWSNGNFRHLSADAESFSEMAVSLADRNVPLLPFFGDAAHEDLESFVGAGEFSALVFDFSPLRPHVDLMDRLSAISGVPVFEADSRCLVPAWSVTDKMEIGARTFRPKFWKNLVVPFEIPAVRFPDIESPFRGPAPVSISDALDSARCDRTVTPVFGFASGETPAKAALSDFVSNRLDGYSEGRNDPNSWTSSRLSAYLKNGNLDPAEIYLAVSASGATEEDRASFLEECFVRRELSENFCLFNPRYDSLEWAPKWALETLSRHAGDKREFVYSETEFDHAATHDDLWNACQRELVRDGRIASYLRMYWAKKILEWSDSPERAYSVAIGLNDRYALDGRSPNGYVWVLWAIAGLHDRPWFERETYGSVRYMNRNGCERKFDVGSYVAKHVP